MPRSITFYPLNGGYPASFYANRAYDCMIESFAAELMPLGWERDECEPFDFEFEAQCDRYTSCELFHPETEDSVEALFFDGKLIGILDQPVPDNVGEFVTYEELERIEGKREAHAELMQAVNREAAE